MWTKGMEGRCTTRFRPPGGPAWSSAAAHHNALRRENVILFAGARLRFAGLRQQTGDRPFPLELPPDNQGYLICLSAMCETC